MKAKIQKIHIIEEEIEIEDNFPNRRWLENIKPLIEIVKSKQEEVERYISKLDRI